MQNPKTKVYLIKKKLFGFTYSYSIYEEFEIWLSDLSLLWSKNKEKTKEKKKKNINYRKFILG